MGRQARFYAASTRWGKGSKKPTKQDLRPLASKQTGSGAAKDALTEGENGE